MTIIIIIQVVLIGGLNDKIIAITRAIIAPKHNNPANIGNSDALPFLSGVRAHYSTPPLC